MSSQVRTLTSEAAPENVASPVASAKKTSDERKELAARVISSQLAQGNRRIETQSDYSAVIVRGKPVNHVLHLILSVLSIGLWGAVWLLLVLVGGEKREMIQVDEYGNTSIQQL